MSPELLAAANDAIDSQRESILASRDQSRQQADAAAAEQGPQVGNTPSPAGGEWADGSPHSDKLSGYPRMDVGNLLTLPTPLSNPFREMAAHPAIVQRLNWIQGPGFKLNTLGFTIVSERGCGGQALHANGTPLCKQRAPQQPKDPAAEPRCCLAGGAVNAFDLHDGRFHAGSLNVAWQLHDVDKEQDGGFVVYVSRLRSTLRPQLLAEDNPVARRIPGSHKASYPCPTEDPGHPRVHELGVVQPRVRAGDAVIFMGAATTHGAWAVTGERPRRASLFSYVSRHEALINRPALASL